MTKEQIEQLEEYAFKLRNNRDYYSRAKIIEMMVDEVKKLNKTAVISSDCDCKPQEEAERD